MARRVILAKTSSSDGKRGYLYTDGVAYRRISRNDNERRFNNDAVTGAMSRHSASAYGSYKRANSYARSVSANARDMKGNNLSRNESNQMQAVARSVRISQRSNFQGGLNYNDRKKAIRDAKIAYGAVAG